MGYLKGHKLISVVIYANHSLKIRKIVGFYLVSAVLFHSFISETGHLKMIFF